jgi:hypothetical protein
MGGGGKEEVKEQSGDGGDFSDLKANMPLRTPPGTFTDKWCDVDRGGAW